MFLKCLYNKRTLQDRQNVSKKRKREMLRKLEEKKLCRKYMYALRKVYKKKINSIAEFNKRRKKREKKFNNFFDTPVMIIILNVIETKKSSS